MTFEMEQSREIDRHLKTLGKVSLYVYKFTFELLNITASNQYQKELSNQGTFQYIDFGRNLSSST